MKQRAYMWIFIALVAVYMGLSLLLPPEYLRKYQMSEASLRLVSLTIILPVGAIQLSALYGFLKFKAYANKIKKTKEGPAFMQIANGLMVLTFGLPINSAASSILNYVARTNTDLQPTAIILKGYIALIFPFIAFLLIAKGAEGLIKTLKRPVSKQWTTFGLLGVIVLTAVYTELIVARAPVQDAKSGYHLPTWLILATIAIPYLYIWCKGLRAAYHIFIYKNRIKGTVYRNALDYLAKGLVIIIFASIIIQVLITVTERITSLSVAPILLIVYLLLGLYAVGFGMVARGAKKLKKIEEV